LEDILEEIFGEIKDEHDMAEELVEKQLAEDEFIFSGRIEIDYLNEKYGFNIPHGDYETLAGYIVAHYENIPEQDEKINIDNFEIHILMVSETKIDTVKMKVLPI
jgi:CBS domain containing-hemolysin-like protein